MKAPPWARRYLALLEVDPAPPGPGLLAALHRAHVRRVPWHNFDLVLGTPAPVDARSAVDRILAGRGGHCFELNGAFGLLLRELGYQVREHRAGVHPRFVRRSPGATGDHLVLSVADPGDATSGMWWLVDVGGGDLLFDPLPLREGRYRTGGYALTLHRRGTESDGWRLDHDPRGGSAGIEIAPGPPAPGLLDRTLRHLASDPASPLRELTVVQRRHAAGADIAYGAVLSRAGAGADVVLDDESAWHRVLADDFGLRLDAFDPMDLRGLWQRVVRARDFIAAAPRGASEHRPESVPDGGKFPT